MWNSPNAAKTVAEMQTNVKAATIVNAAHDTSDEQQCIAPMHGWGDRHAARAGAGTQKGGPHSSAQEADVITKYTIEPEEMKPRANLWK